MDFPLLTWMLFLGIAILYSSIGHAGASGYLAIMALLSFSPDTMKPTSLILNITVALIASIKFIKEGYFDKKIFSLFIMTALPMAYIGGYVSISPYYFKLCAGIFLLLSAVMLVVREYFLKNVDAIKPIPIQWGLSIGAVIGFISGIIGVGGGIFLSPVLIMAKWATAKQAAGVSALFILLNSIAGLAGHMSALKKVEVHIFYWVLAVMFGGLIGSYWGTKKWNSKMIIACLFVVLVSAGMKFIFVDFVR